MVVGDIVRCWRGVGICYRRQHPRDWLACRHSLGFGGCLRRGHRFKGARRSPAKAHAKYRETERRPNTKAETQRRGTGDGRRRKIVEGQDSVLLAQTALCPRRPPSAIRHGLDAGDLGGIQQRRSSSLPSRQQQLERLTRGRWGYQRCRSGQSPQGAACHRSCRSTKGGLSPILPHRRRRVFL